MSMKQKNFGKSTKILALHGFLGLPSDWSFLPEAEAFPVFSPDSLRHEDFMSWAQWFNGLNSMSASLLIGYSLGGRLALHALIEEPKNWQGAVIISANPGLNSEDLKQKRIKNDARWTEKFLQDPWNSLINEWNSQSIFKHETSHPERKENDFNRKDLARAHAQWSLGKQKNLRGDISKLPMPILWIFGEHEKGEIQLSHPKSKIWIAKEGGHRLLWTHKEALQEQIQRFKESL